MNESLRAAIIAEWRGLPEPKPAAHDFRATAELLPKIMQRLGLKERLHEAEVIEVWSKIVGEFIASHSAPVALREGILYVRVLQPALHYELEQVSKIDIVRKLKQRFGGKVIRDVRFRIG
jgi:predicted nucleic acid-binding Zn ribbon protein